MIRYDRLSQKPGIFKGFSGISVAEFKDLETKVEPQWLEKERQRLERPERKRAAGGGRKTELPMGEQLLMTMVWLRLYLTIEAFGYLFGVDKATVSRYTRPCCRRCERWGRIRWDGRSHQNGGRGRIWCRRGRLSRLICLCGCHGTASSTSQGKTEEEQYSGKKKRHTCKTQIVVNEHGEVRDVSISVAGSVHDRKLFGHSGVADKIPKDHGRRRPRLSRHSRRFARPQCAPTLQELQASSSH